MVGSGDVTDHCGVTYVDLDEVGGGTETDEGRERGEKGITGVGL